jgi:dUTP pyrophosphatase
MKYGLKILGGVIDSGFRGEIIIGIINLSDQNYKIKKDQKIAQMIIQKKEVVEFIEIENLSESERGKKLHGSSGK